MDLQFVAKHLEELRRAFEARGAADDEDAAS